METIQDQKDSLLAEMVRRLVEGFHPERIYLFGSRARGDAKPDSDFDLLVVVESSDQPGYRLCQRAHELLGSLNVSKDVIVLTRAEFEPYKDVIGTLPELALHEGKLLYAT